MPDMICKQCGTAFYTKPSAIKKGGGKFCSRGCYGAWRSSGAQRTTRLPVICQWCGDEFLGVRHAVLSGRKKFCSKECLGKWISRSMSGENSPNYKGQKLNCPICGTEFSRAPWEIKDGRKKYCSRKCFNQWQSENKSGENHPNWQGDNEVRNCAICDRGFSVRPRNNQKTCGSRECRTVSQVLSAGGENHYAWKGGPEEKTCDWCNVSFIAPHGVSQRFCNQKCMGKWFSKHRCGGNHPSWNPDKEDRIYPPEFNKRFKGKIRKRDNHSCAICRMYGHDVHHIDYDKQNSSEENLITLCSSCHGTTNVNREYWLPALTFLLFYRLSNFT